MNLAPFIDHTLLKNTTTAAEIESLCREAEAHHFAAVCVPPYFVADAVRLLGNSSVKVATVIGFPFGYHTYQTKEKEAQKALADGAAELDLVMNLAAFKSNDLVYLETEINVISTLTTAGNKILKVIIESGVLTDEEIIKCCQIYQRFPVQFLKTSTGFAGKGASVDAVRLMRRHLPEHIEIKASGGIRTRAFALELVDAGATRLGCSSGVALVSGAEGRENY